MIGPAVNTVESPVAEALDATNRDLVGCWPASPALEATGDAGL